MKFHDNSHSLRALFLALCLTVCLIPSVSWGESEENEDATDLFSAWQEQDVTASRVPKPLSQTAENVTVITAADIRALNAHTLADILDTIPGIQVQHNGGPGITAYTFIQSSSFKHVQVYVDGVSITNLSDNFSETSLIPARIIERVEIVKGSASAAWGSALAGVINVTTKSPEKGRAIAGVVSASIGERTSTDDALELSGSSDRLGYYLSGGFLGSNGVLPNTQTNAHARLTWELPGRGQLYAVFNRSQTGQGDLFVPAYDLKENLDKTLLFTTIGLRKPLSERMELEISGRHSFFKSSMSWLNISDGLTWQPDLPTGITSYHVSGASLMLSWRGDNNLLVAGSDYNHLKTSSNTVDTNTYSPFSRIADRWGTYLNDTITLGDISITPGARFDHTQTSGEQFSFSLGGTWQATETTMMRVYAARGFGAAQFLDVNKQSEKIWTTQVGVESTAVPYLWLKGTLFRNETWGSEIERQEALGAEAELRTTPLWNTSLGAGYTFVDTTLEDGSQVNYAPRHTIKLSLRYDDKTYRGILTGSHINWNSMPGDNPRYGGFLWDLHLGATLIKRENSSLELFVSGRNLFNNGQSLYDMIPTPGRWFEGGVRVNF
jgi:vitamin B12 transporter